MISRWQITESSEKLKYLLFLDGSKQELAFIYRKISPFVESARYAEKPYNYCFVLKNIDPAAIENIKKMMSVLTEITKKTPLPHDFQREKGDDFFAKLEKNILNILKLKSEKYKGEGNIESPRDLGVEIEPPRSWLVLDDKERQKPQIKSDDFFEKIQNQLVSLGKSKLKKAQETIPQEETEKKPDIDFSFLENIFSKPEAPETRQKKPEKPEISKVSYPKRLKFEHSKTFAFSPFAPVNPLQNFDTLQITSSNRNPHALATSVAQNPGEYDIPFTITGAAGTGKTHFLNAIYHVLQKQLGADKILFTTGIRLSKLMGMPEKDILKCASGKKPDEFAALLVDNIGNMLITSANKNPIQTLFENFINSRKQIIFTSRFGKEKLESIFAEKSFKIPLISSVGLKPLPPEEHGEILKKYISDIGLTQEQKNAILTDAEFKPTYKDIKRIYVLKNLANNFPRENSEIIKLVKGEKNSFGISQSELGKISLFKLPDENYWGRWGVFYHKETPDYAKYVLYKLYETAKKLGIDGGWENVFMQSYDEADIKFFPAQMAYYAFEEKVNAILAIGPKSEHPFHKYTTEFFSMLTCACYDIGLNCGCISCDDLSNPAVYSATLADLLE